MLAYFFLTIINILIYLYGFFPINQNTADEIFNVPNQLHNVTLDTKGLYAPHFDRVVLVVIDALRNDFIQKDTTPFISSKVKSDGCFVNVKVECPTVTLPRIKSLTTGGVPQFIDVVLNLGDSHALTDSLLHILHNNSKNTVFYGDDTWLRMFPRMFTRYEGVTSFYVNDFYEVDNNVTRNVKKEVEKNDWDMMILHYLGSYTSNIILLYMYFEYTYKTLVIKEELELLGSNSGLHICFLGLDHIGHVFGPRSDLVPKKLREMDKIIEFIYTKLMKEPRTLILVTGDHGMKDSGGHGGSTSSETNVPLIVLGSACKGASISQTDIPANLAVLMGTRIPTTSIGLIQKPLLAGLSPEQYLFALRYNTLFLSSKTGMCKDDIELATKYHAIYVKNKDETVARKVEGLYQNCSQSVHDYLITSSTHQNIELMIVAILNLCYIFFEVINVILSGTRSQVISISIIILLNVFYYILGYFVAFIIVTTIFIIPTVLSLLMYLLITSGKIKFEHMFLVTMTLVHPLIFAASSFIEEEHQYWYFIITTFVYLYFINSIKFRNIYSLCWPGLLVLLKICRNINQTGDKWASLPDLADYLLEKDNYLYLTGLFIICLVIIFVINYKLGGTNIFSLFVNGCIFGFILGNYFIESGDARLLLQKIIWLLIIIQALLAFWYKLEFVPVWISVCLLLLKPFNIVFIILCIASSKLFGKKNKNTEVLTLFHMWLGKTLFFMQGHSNSLASVDVSSGYVGLSSYIPTAVAFQVLSHTYAFPILSTLLLLKNKNLDQHWAFSIMFLHQLLVTIVYFIMSVIQRHHIFIWSVFAPKLLVESSHCFILFIETVLYFVYEFCRDLRLYVN